MKTALLLIALALGIASCGVRGDPEPPAKSEQAQ